MTTRAQLRRQIRAARRGLSERERREAAERLACNLARTDWFRNARRIACYLANDGELDPWPVMERAWAAGKTCCLPVLSPVTGNRLWFVDWRPGEPLAGNRFGIPEPVHAGWRLQPAWALDLVLTPLVAFDPLGNRLGMGGGYYDRTFAYLRRRRRWLKPRLVGMAYELQKVAALPHADWDVPLEGIVTEAGCYAGGGSPAG
ncbi:MAG: 5-formyltetrahydrofolate cyclo-ligase [Gammaproteobacteria bacterium]|nr:5-formyltetrahydrofolate cyclo-ligase [Gammaproteobacteria bacterium]